MLNAIQNYILGRAVFPIFRVSVFSSITDCSQSFVWRTSVRHSSFLNRNSQALYFYTNVQCPEKVRYFRVQNHIFDYLQKEKEGGNEPADEEEEEGFALLLESVSVSGNKKHVVKIDSDANHELAGALVLYFDDFRYPHSIFWPNKVWTDSYYDSFAVLPAIVPKGTLGILGLGGGTIARILLAVWPSLIIEGWEIDLEVIYLARKYFGLLELEDGIDRFSKANGRLRRGSKGKKNSKYGRSLQKVDGFPVSGEENRGGRLVVHIGDALGVNAIDEKKLGFACLVVDLFNGKFILPALQDPATWQLLKGRLMANGRIMVNCGGVLDKEYRDILEMEEWKENVKAVILAAEKVFPGEILVQKFSGQGNNLLLLTGPIPNWTDVENSIPEELKEYTNSWHSSSLAEF